MFTLASDADEFLLTLDADNVIVACSVLRSRGVEPASVDCQGALGLSFVQQLPELHQTALGRLLAEVRQTRRPCTQDIRFDGLNDHFSCSVSLLTQSVDAPALLACLLRNHGATAHPAIDRFEQALSLARVAWFERDLKTDIGIGSPSLAQIYGLDHPRGPWHFDEVCARIVPEDAAQHAENIATGLSPRTDDLEARVINYRIRRPDGTLRHLEVRYRNLFSLERPRSYGLIFDVTDRHDAGIRLRESEARLRLALSAAGMSSWEWNLRTGQIKTSRTLSVLLGLPANTNPSNVVFDATHPTDVAALRTRFADVVRNGERDPFTIEYRFRWADGNYRWVELRARAAFDEQNRSVSSIYGVAADITQRREAEAERDRLQRQLSQAQKMEALGQLTGGVAHDFNNILASVLGYSSLALQRFGAANPPKLADYLGEVIRAGERARDLVAQMLAFSRGETSEVSPLAPAPLVEQMMKMLRPILPSSIDIRLDLAHDLPAVAANAVQLQQVLLNLCINARDATLGVGSITIAARCARFVHADCASCHQQFSGNFIALSVSDNGQGITEAQRTRIFEPFYTTGTDQKGTGMGLATVHGIVHRHGGHIGLESQPAVGSTFTIALPVADAAQRQSSGTATEGDASALPKAGWPARILVVDDEPSLAICTAEILDFAGFVTTVETDSELAARRFEAAPDDFDLIITDQTMPRLTGHQLSVIVLKRRPNLPVLLVTGHSTVVDEQQALALGIRCYLRKPVAREALLKAVLSVLPATSPAAAQAS